MAPGFLFVHGTSVDNGILQNLSLHCPLIEKLSLIKCCGSGTSALKLHGFEKLNTIKFVDHLQTISVDVPSLKKFHCRKRSQRCELHVNDSKNLEVLKLKGSFITGDLISKSPVLKVLVLHKSLLESINIPSPLLEKLKLSTMQEGFIVTMATRSLQSLKFSAKTLFSSETLRLQEVRVRLALPSSSNFHNLKESLAGLTEIKFFVLRIVVFRGWNLPPSYSCSNLFLGTSIPRLPDISHLKLKLTICATGPPIRHSLPETSMFPLLPDLFSFRPKCIQLESGWGANNLFMQALCRLFLFRENCSAASPIECCRHAIRDVEILQFRENQNEIGGGRSVSVVDFLAGLPRLKPSQKICFMLTWL